MEQVFNILEKIFFTNLFGEVTLYSILATVLKFIFVIIILAFIYSVVKMITMDMKNALQDVPVEANYLKLLNNPREFDYPIRNEYYLSDNTTIGRADDNSIVIKDKQVSKHQARIIERQGVYLIDDLGSTNPTLVNGQEIIQPTQLYAHDIINFAGVEFSFINGDDYAEH